MARSVRLDRKLHKLWLDYGVIDASQMKYWRKTLFESSEYTSFDINSENIEKLPSDVARAIIKYNLKYKVAKVAPSETDSWLSDDGLVVFKFWAVNHKDIVKFSGNNPDVV